MGILSWFKVRWEQESTKRGAVKLFFGLAAMYFSFFGDIGRAQSLLDFAVAFSGFLGFARDDGTSKIL